MKTRLRKGMLVVTLGLIDPPRKSKSGKTLLIATSRGVRRTALRRSGKPVYVNANAFVRPDVQRAEKKRRESKSKALRKGKSKR